MVFPCLRSTIPEFVKFCCLVCCDVGTNNSWMSLFMRSYPVYNKARLATVIRHASSCGNCGVRTPFRYIWFRCLIQKFFSLASLSCVSWRFRHSILQCLLREGECLPYSPCGAWISPSHGSLIPAGYRAAGAPAESAVRLTHCPLLPDARRRRDADIFFINLIAHILRFRHDSKP